MQYVFNESMENEGRRRIQLFPSRNIEALRAALDAIANEPTPQPDSLVTGRIVREVFPQLCRMRRNGHSLKMMVSYLEKNSVKITRTALSGYMKKLGWKVEGVTATEVRQEKLQPEKRASKPHAHFTIKPDTPL
jgi:hypothetical protein